MIYLYLYHVVSFKHWAAEFSLTNIECPVILHITAWKWYNIKSKTLGLGLQLYYSLAAYKFELSYN